MNFRQPFVLYLTLFYILIASCSTKNRLPLTVVSPGKKVSLTIEMKDSILSYSVQYNGINVIEPSRLGLQTEIHFKNGFEVTGISQGKLDKEWKPVYGEYKKIRNQYHSLLVQLREKGVQERSVDVEFRIYNEGVAFHYILPEQSPDQWEIISEDSEFNFIDNTKAFPIFWAEQCYSKKPIPLSEMQETVQIPLTVKTENCFASILEANVDNFPRMQLRKKESGVNTKLLGKASVKTPFSTPWRLILLAEDEAGLIENEYLILNLNDECAIADPSWVKAGKTISNEGSVQLKTNELKKLVDFASENNFRYVQLDWGWYGTEVKWDESRVESFKEIMPKEFRNTEWEENTLANPFTVAKGYVPYGWTEQWTNLYTLVDLEMKELISYGKEKNVDICLYVEAGKTLPKCDIDSLFATYQEWGIAGLKPGFVRYGQQENTEWIRNMVKTAAKHKLWLCIHDAHIPDGFERTYPNLMISEGGGGQEHHHPVVQDVMLPFTRCLAGAFDYTPFFYNKGKTNAHMLAFFVTYYCPAQTVRGGYTAWEGNEKKGGVELEFIREVPATWDDTKVLNAQIGEYLTVARRSGESWFVGSMTGDSAQSFSVSLDFLDEEKTYNAVIYSDAINLANDGWCPVKKVEKEVKKGDLVNLNLMEAGGCVMILEPLIKRSNNL